MKGTSVFGKKIIERGESDGTGQTTLTTSCLRNIGLSCNHYYKWNCKEIQF